MTVWLKKVYFKDGVVLVNNEDGVEWMQASVLGVRVRVNDVFRLYPWHQITLCIEDDE